MLLRGWSGVVVMGIGVVEFVEADCVASRGWCRWLGGFDPGVQAFSRAVSMGMVARIDCWLRVG